MINIINVEYNLLDLLLNIYTKIKLTCSSYEEKSIL